MPLESFPPSPVVRQDTQHVWVQAVALQVCSQSFPHFEVGLKRFLSLSLALLTGGLAASGCVAACTAAEVAGCLATFTIATGPV